MGLVLLPRNLTQRQPPPERGKVPMDASDRMLRMERDGAAPNVAVRNALP
jgi:hypothetical protein